MKSLEDFKQSIKESSVLTEREYATITYAAPEKQIAVTDPYTGKIRWKKQRIGRIVIGASKAGLVNANNTPDTQAAPEYSIADMSSSNIKEAKEGGGKGKDSNFDPPYVLVLKRQSIRLFPNNTKVALYYSDKLNKTFSVPYGPGMNPIIQAESILEELQFQEDTKTFSFKSGESMDILYSEAATLLRLYKNLNENNREKLLNTLCESKESFDRVLDFALKREEQLC